MPLAIEPFSRTVVLFVSKKILNSDKIVLNQDAKTVSDEKELCRTFSIYF